jgi:hypothetical protein
MGKLDNIYLSGAANTKLLLISASEMQRTYGIHQSLAA